MSLRPAEKFFNTMRAYGELTRLSKPVGILLLVWPTLWALWIASGGHPAWNILLIFLAGTVCMRSAGCVINDIADRRLDGAVARTRNRPLITGQVSTQEALLVFFVFCLVALGLLWQLNTLSRWLAVPALLLTIIYPFMKRYTHFPQLILGVTFSWGIPMAFAAQTGTVPGSAWFLFLCAALWTIAYDTIYAMVDRPDDLKIGIKSTAILFGKFDTRIIAGLHSTVLLLLIGLGIYSSWHFAYYLGLLAAAAVMVYIQCLIHRRHLFNCFRAFLMSQWVGCAIFVGLWLNYR